ncbi:MAG: 30S ribosomal protein S4 [Thermomicrobiales bacterium]|nr:30S ribosomal protein S4 [Thermomicrobiales bacterium]
MVRHEPKHKVSRRFGIDIYGTGGESLRRRIGTPPGGAPQRRPRVTDYGIQLKEKQKAKAIYGVSETQFRRYYAQAFRQPGDTGDNLLRLLERRLDNVIYRLSLARSRPMARQLVGHGHVKVNGRRVNIPSYQVRPGEVVTLTDAAAQIPGVIEELEANRRVPEWLDRAGHSARVIRLPGREDVDLPINEELIVAFYAR